MAVERACKDTEGKAADEFDFLFELLTMNGIPDYQLSTSRAQVGKALVGAAEKGYNNVVQKLVKLGVYPSVVRGSRRHTALHQYALVGDVAMINFLLDASADANARDADRQTPLHWAALEGQTKAVTALLAKKADVNAEDHMHRTALFDAASKGYIDVVKVLLSWGAKKTVRGGHHQLTALERAQRSSHDEIVKLLER